MPRLGHQLLAGLHIAEDGVGAERKRALHRVEHLHHDHLIPLVPEMFQRSHHTLGIVKKIAQDDNQSPALNPLCHGVQRLRRPRRVAGFENFQLLQNLLEIRLCRTGGKRHPDLFVVDRQPDRIPLFHHQVRQCGGDVGGVFDFPDLTVRGIIHGLAAVEDEVRLQVRLFLELLDIVPVGLSVCLPVDMLDFVPRHVLAMFRELDAKAVVRTLMQTGDKAFNDKAGTEFHVGELCNNAGLKIFKCFLHTGLSRY